MDWRKIMAGAEEYYHKKEQEENRRSGGPAANKTRRDELAGLAMQALLTNEVTKQSVLDIAKKENRLPYDLISEEAYKQADSLIAKGGK
jgi:hypothetical protein